MLRKTLCAVIYARGVADYKGHVGIRELCDICPSAQLALCALAWTPPSRNGSRRWSNTGAARWSPPPTRAVAVAALDEQLAT